MKTLRRLWRRIRGHRLYCAGCGEHVVLPTRKLGRVIDISGPEVQGWTFDSDRGWWCTVCTEVLGG